MTEAAEMHIHYHPWSTWVKKRMKYYKQLVAKKYSEGFAVRGIDASFIIDFTCVIRKPIHMFPFCICLCFYNTSLIVTFTP